MNSRHALLVFLLLALLAARRLRHRGAAAARHPGRPDDAVRRRGASTRRRCTTRIENREGLDGRHRRVRAEGAGATDAPRAAALAVVSQRARGARSSAAPDVRAQVVQLDTSHIGLLRGADEDAHVRVLAVGRHAGLAVVAGSTCAAAGRRTSCRARASRRRPGRAYAADHTPTSSPRRACTTSATSAAGRSPSRATRRRSPAATRTAPSTTTGRTRCT